MTFHWLYSLWFGYEWPSIKGNGPEDTTMLLLVSACIPVVRKMIRNEVHKANGELHKVEQFFPRLTKPFRRIK